MKYQFKKNGADDYSLIYGDKEIKFKSNVQIVNDLQEIVPRAKMKMLEELSQKGISIKSLTIVEKKDGKTYYDNSNREEMEQLYVQREQNKVFEEIITGIFGKPFEELSMEIGLTTEKEINEFSIIFGKCLCGQYDTLPSGEEKNGE